MSTQKNEHNPDNLTPEQYGAPEFRLLALGEPIRVGDELWNTKDEEWQPTKWGGIYDVMTHHNAYRRRITPPTDTTGSGREGETPETDAAEHGPGRGGFAGHCSADFARRLERQRDAALAQVEALRRDGERWQEYRKYVGEELTRLRNALFSYALPDEDGRHEIAEKALGTEVLRELRRAAIDSAQRQEGM